MAGLATRRPTMVNGWLRCSLLSRSGGAYCPVPGHDGGPVYDARFGSVGMAVKQDLHHKEVQLSASTAIQRVV
jgi:hypothetical protein